MPEQNQKQIPSFSILLPNSPQVAGALDRMLIVALTWAVSKGYIPLDMIGDYSMLIIAAGAVIWALITSRSTNLALQASNIPGTTVITTAAIAKATPDSPNILSNTEVKAVDK